MRERDTELSITITMANAYIDVGGLICYIRYALPRRVQIYIYLL